MNADELLKLVYQYDLLPENPDFFTCALDIRPKTYPSPQSVREALAAFAPTQGWLCLQSEVVRFLPGEAWPAAGVILYGEVCNAHSALHIQQDGSGGWLLTTYREQSGDAYLVEETRLIAEADDAHHLRYHVYWGSADPLHPHEDDGQGWRQVAAVFVGFEQGKN